MGLRDLGDTSRDKISVGLEKLPDGPSSLLREFDMECSTSETDAHELICNAASQNGVVDEEQYPAWVTYLYKGDVERAHTLVDSNDDESARIENALREMMDDETSDDLQRKDSFF